MIPPDHGPIYTETVLGRFPVEPWNTFSNVLFLLIAIHFARRSGLSYKKFPLLTVSIPVLFIGFIGGTVYHATRSNRMWLMMDYIPILLLGMMAAFYFWTKIFGKWTFAAVLSILYFLFFELLLHELRLSIQGFIAIAYLSLACWIIVPAALYCWRQSFRGGSLLLRAICFFAVALYFRTIDRSIGAEVLPMGTHWMWHVLGATSTYYYMEYVYQTDLQRPLHEVIFK